MVRETRAILSSNSFMEELDLFVSSLFHENGFYGTVTLHLKLTCP